LTAAPERGKTTKMNYALTFSTKDVQMAKAPRNQQQDNFVAILREMDSPDNRTSAIVAAAFIENNLALAIMARFRQLQLAEHKDIFENRGVLADFMCKIDIGFALDIYGPFVRDDLHRIRSIRNKFAHYLEIRDFDHPEVASLCDNLNARRFLDSLTRPKGRTTPTRKAAFLDTAAHLAARFDLERLQGRRPVAGGAGITPEY
jgi:hypothetical protein